jgi:adenylate cyclase
MPTIAFERTGFVVDVPDGGRVLDLCDDHPRAGIPFSCRDANCGTCRVEVLEGEPLCEPPDEDERALLEHLGNRPRMRLGCQLVLKAGDGRVRLRVTL